MNNIEFKCNVGSETIDVDFFDNLAGIEIKRETGESIGLLLSRQDTVKLVEFLEARLER